MLVRAAGRKQRRHTSLKLTQLADSLYLPFLAPAHLRWSELRSQQTPQVRLQSSHAALQARPHAKLQTAAERQTRNLGTFADSYQPSSLPPPPGISDKTFQQWTSFAPSSDPDLPFIDLKEASREAEANYSRAKGGIAGGPDDLIENVETNLRVKRFGRAKRIIHRLVSQGGRLDQLEYAHSRLLEEQLYSMSESPEGKTAVFEDMRQWFDSDVLGQNVPVNAEMIAVMLEAAVLGVEGAKQERIVRRYYELAVAHDLEDEVINSEVYSDDALWKLAEIVPEFAAEEFTLSPEADAMNQHALDAEGQQPQQATSAPQEEQLSNTLPGIFGDIPELVDTNKKIKDSRADKDKPALPEGLLALKDALSRAEAALDPAKYNAPEMPFLTARQRQEKIEESASEAAIERWKKEEDKLKDMGIFSELDPQRPLGALMWQWYSALLPALKEELETCRKVLNDSETSPKYDERLYYAAHLESIPVQQVAANTILYVMSLVAGGKDRDSGNYTSDMKLARLSVSLGKAMQHEADMLARKRAERKAKQHKRTVVKAETTSKKAKRAKEPADLTWSTTVRAKLGAMLISKLIETAKISISRPHPRTKEIVTQVQPAFLHKTIYEHGRKVSSLSACQDLVRKMDRDPVGHLIAKRLPMVIKPEPWTDFNKGGYLYYPNPVIRFGTGDKVPRDYAHAAIQRGDLDKVFSALNALGQIPWRINEDVLRVQIEAWNSGEPIANFAPREPKKVVIEKPVDESDMNAMRRYKQMDTDQNNLISGYHSQRCFQNFQMEIARAFRHEKMYFPHNVDFRGRAYPIPPYLNHMGADNARALMKFANGKELGTTGLRWLKIHLANVFGYDKASLQEREAFVMDHLPEIYDSATNPLDGQRWWLQSEDAWQTLAACCELKKALDSPEPTKYVSNLPIHQDGTCNGLQHYAALGGDAIGARQVNLEPGDRPSDVYTAVADAVKAEVKRDYDAGHPVAKILHGRITRKVVKQPVMTNVYGVTYYGARAQVKKQLEELFPEVNRTHAVDHLTMASYIAKKIFKSLGEMFTGAQAIQQWLGACADRISTCVTPEQVLDLQREADSNVKFVGKTPKGTKRAYKMNENAERVNASKQLFRSSVIWTTPLRLPVVQPYRSTKRKLVYTKLAKLALQEPGTTDPVSKRKQLQGFPPNFIHSLDATHMMLSANKCAENNITFASIHDSFWTHACDINDMSLILRDAFVDMHSEDIIGRLRHEFVARYKGAMYLAAVDLRSAVGKKIIEHQRTRSLGRGGPKRNAVQPYQVTELLREQERFALLQSEDPEERQRGEEMVTSGSIFAAVADAEGALAVPTEITDAKLGEIPEGDLLANAVDANAAELSEHEDLDAEDLHDHASCSPSGVEKIANQESFLASLKEKRPVKKSQPVRKAYVWLPLKFPEVPEKGTFDVRRLKQSTYFFH